MITNLSAIPYTLVNTNDKISPCVKAINDSEIIGLDIETTGLDCFKDKIRLFQIATDTYTYVIDFL